MADRAVYAVEEFAAELSRILESHGSGIEAVWSIGPLMQRLAEQGRDLWRVGEPRLSNSGLSGRLLHLERAGRFMLALTPFPANGVTPVHSHEGWGVICLLEGSERYSTWRRLDNGSGRGAELELVQDHHLQPGDLAYWFNEPYNVHRQWPGDRGCLEIVLLAGRGRRLHHFDLELQTISAAP